MQAEEIRRNRQAQNSWDRKAAFWDRLHGSDGNRFHRELIEPSVLRLLQLQHGEAVLDVACGSGVLARRLAALGADVTAVDFSQTLLNHARRRPGAAAIDYRRVDATDEAALTALGPRRFAAVTCTMALMDLVVIEPLLRAVRRLLQPDGRFVFATAHPAFNSPNPKFVAELIDVDGELQTNHWLSLDRYLDVAPTLAVGAQGEPAPHPFMHRSLQQLLGPAFAAGLVLDGLEEPTFNAAETDPKPLTWMAYPQFPPVLTGRLRVMPTVPAD